MKNYEDFKTFYSTELLHELKLLEKARTRNTLYSVLAVLLTAVCTAAVVKFLFPATQHRIVTWQLAILAFLLINGLLLRWTWRGFHHQFKSRVINKLLQFINPALNYNPTQHVGEYAFDQSDIFPGTYTGFEGEDLIKGTVEKTTIKCSEIRVTNSSNESTTTIFSGLFFVADFNKNFKGQTFVLPDTAEQLLGRFGRKLQSINRQRGQLIQLDDTEFEREFVVYGSDQIESRYILTPDLMQKILDLRYKFDNPLYLSFARSTLYLAIPTSRNLFELPGWGKKIDYLKAYEYFQDLQMIINLVEDLHLNTRIWSKE